jgi:Ca2+-binding EF-hand superfamily protein
MRWKSFVAFALPILAVAAVAFAQTGAPDKERSPGPPERGLLHQADADGDGVVTQQEFMDLFKRLDANGDGVLSEDEMPHHRMGGRHGRHGDPQKFAGGALARAADTNQDGKVTAQEWQALIGSIAADKNGTVTADALEAAVPPPKGAPEHRRPGNPLYWALTEGGNKELKIDDLNALFDKLDTNQDGVLSADEMPHPMMWRHRGQEQ